MIYYSNCKKEQCNNQESQKKEREVEVNNGRVLVVD
jgi:hypothetical protein